MKLYQTIWYKWKLSKLPNEVPFEKLSGYIWAKTALQITAKNLTIKDVVWGLVQHYVTIPIKGWWWCLHYYIDADGTAKNSLNDKPYYVHKHNGHYALYSKPCCEHCKKKETVYPKYVLGKNGEMSTGQKIFHFLHKELKKWKL